MKIRPVGAELFHADGQTDITKIIVAFRRFGEAPKKVILKLTPELVVTCKTISVNLNNPASSNELCRNKINQSVLMYRDVQRTE
jgi:hypothetical protein